MLKIFLLFILCFNLYAVDKITPSKVLTTSGDVQDMKLKDNILYAGTSNGTVEIFDINTNEKLKEIKIPDIKDFMGDTIPAKIYSIDILNNKILIVSQGMNGYRNIFIYENSDLKKIIDIEKKYYLQKAYFVDDNNIIFALLSNQIGLYNFTSQKLKYLIQISASSFSDFVINQNKQTIVTTDESGIVKEININEGSVIKQYKTLNLDKIYQLDFKNNVVITAGQDRKSSIYKNQSSYKLEFDFLLYSCALNKNGKYGAIAFNEENEVLIFNIDTKEYLKILTGQEATVTKILFNTKNQVFVSSDSNKINYYNF
ncbi:WD40 repeat domain-containing protein [Halarcobacter sp.]|uniref:WD40 repeat domain-containing protein n=1 Tax=Halarcobacter sp. TaxID=2321133 RepID=UPI0029F5C53C|nr:WD40 repeat domain-containing protein [Halarcobacter sp.]